MRIYVLGRKAMAIAGAAVLGTCAAHAENGALGVWIDHTGRGAVEITDCGGKLCGHVAWVEEAKHSDQCGKQIIGNVKPISSTKWDKGWIYDPDRDSKYDVELTLVGTDKLKVMGYAGTKWLSETYTWKRAPADLKKCNASGDSAAAPAVEKPAAKAERSAEEPRADDGERKETKRDDDDLQLKPASEPETAERSVEKDSKQPADKPKAKDEDETASAESDDDSDASDAPKAGGGKIVARIVKELENGDGPIKLKRSGGTCKVDVPYVGLVSFPCEDK